MAGRRERMPRNFRLARGAGARYSSGASGKRSAPLWRNPTMSQPKPVSPGNAARATPFYYPLAAWALAFGCAVGWDAFVMPWNDFLPVAGPLGTAIGVLVGALVMAIVAWNFHVMINRLPGPGSVYSYAAAAFGADHGFLCGWFLCFTYMAIVWLDATILGVVAHYAFGTFFRFGFRYTVAGLDVHFGYILLSVAAIAVAAAICCRRRFARALQTVFAVVFLAGIVACFLAALRQGGGFGAMTPVFATGPEAPPPLSQILRIVALAPWLFIGFETVSIVSGNPRFPAKRAFLIMMAALATSVAAYALLAAIPALAPGEGTPNWTAAVALIAEPLEDSAFAAAAAPLGAAGKAVVVATLLAAIFTNLVGNTIAASRLLCAMAADGALPAWLGRTTPNGAPRNAVLAIAALSVFVIPLGRTATTIVVDLALVGSALAYAYTSAATLKTARATASRVSRATGLVGLVLSIVILLLYILPAFTAHTSLMSTQSYLVVVLWCIAGLAAFLFVFRHDKTRRFGQSTVVWLSLSAVVLFMAFLWIRKSTTETTQRALEAVIAHHEALHQSEYHLGRDPSPPVPDWRPALRAELDIVNRAILRDNLVQTCLAVLAFALMFALYTILRRREHQHELEKARAKSYFFSTVSHDIRTPLNAIIGFSEMLKSGIDDPAERTQALDSIAVSGKTLLGLVNDVLDLSKLESGKMEIAPEPTDVPALLRLVLDSFRAAGSNHAFDLRFNVPPMPLLLLDPQRLRQIAFNLLGNAVKFTHQGYVELRASYALPPGAGTGAFTLQVEDTGCGISPEDLARIGSAYVQLGNSRTRNGGTGLGLAICRQLASAMGGTLSAASTLGKGSTFTITLPSVPPAPRPAPSSPPATPSQPVPSVPPAQASAPRRILLVDDSKMNLMVLKAHLKHLGNFDLAFATDGQQALELLNAPANPPFDLVFTDMWMPNLDGDALVRAIRDNPRLASIRVVIVTADVELQANAAALGFDAILLKPVTTDKLSAILASS